MTGGAEYSGAGGGGGAGAALPSACTARTGPSLSIPDCSPGQPRKLVFKRFSCRHKGLLTSLMPPFNTELFHIPSRLRFYSEWQGMFPLGKLEKCFFFFCCFFCFFFPSQLASIFHPKRRAGGGSSAGRGQHSAEINGWCFWVAEDDDGVPRAGEDPHPPSL